MVIAYCDKLISIHAPTRGATPVYIRFSGTVEISIHAPTRGATTTYAGTVRLSAISIHAPTRGATKAALPIPSNMGISIHAPTRGATPFQPLHQTLRLNFNSRTYTRCDSFSCTAADTASYFNSRTYTRCDEDIKFALFHGEISIHAPTRGATFPFFIRQFQFVISIHAPTRGATFRRHRDQRHRAISIHAPTRGATISTLNKDLTALNFNSRTYTRCDRLGTSHSPIISNFNSRTYTRCDRCPY